MGIFSVRNWNWKRGLQAAALACVVGSAVFVSTAAMDSGDRFNKLGGKLMCTCGCAQMLLGCDHVGCPNRGEEMDRLRSGISSGADDKTILAGFVKEYGVVVLSAPPGEGFNILAWIMPFTVAAIALVGTVLLVKHWAKQQPALKKQTAAEAAAEESVRERIRRDTEGGF
ncbi:MAG TPA: cytochrome c-type biogenesis protein CcmH [Acidobacteriaceae bacterium]|jgi:cytochrome c-type biogenesis protein CcmH|nr:cytochrome c-type biogenesis protein CcmH [Acidobacteriaceae bacterium]